VLIKIEWEMGIVETLSVSRESVLVWCQSTKPFCALFLVLPITNRESQNEEEKVRESKVKEMRGESNSLHLTR
jgi:hypothetical protein